MERCTDTMPLPSDWSARESRRVLAAGTMLLVLLLAGCSQSNSTRLPELASIPRQILSDDEQKRAVDEMNARRESHTAEAIKEIEQGRRSAGPGRAEANNRKDEQRTSSVLSNGRDHP